MSSSALVKRRSGENTRAKVVTSVKPKVAVNSRRWKSMEGVASCPVVPWYPVNMKHTIATPKYMTHKIDKQRLTEDSVDSSPKRCNTSTFVSYRKVRQCSQDCPSTLSHAAYESCLNIGRQ